MKWTEIGAGNLHAAEQRLRVAFGDNADVVIERINADPIFVKEITSQIVSQALVTSKMTTSLNSKWIQAREIMGENFLGVEEAIKYFHVRPSRRQLAALREIPFPIEELSLSKDTHILVAAFPVCALSIRDVASKLFCEQGHWYDNESFARCGCRVGWHLVRKTPVNKSLSKTYQEQESLITKSDEVPTAQLIIYTTVGYFLANSRHLFLNTYVRTSSIDSSGNHVRVAFYLKSGICISPGSDNVGLTDLGISSERKL